MATTTTKLGLTKPAYTDVVDVADLNDNADKLDAAAGFTIVANAAARPASPWTGQVIYQVDVTSSFMWDGSAWQPAGGGGGSIEISATAPASPSAGDLWWDSDNGNLYIYYDDGDSQQWVAANGPQVFVGTSAPAGYQGQLWFDSTTGKVYIYYDDGTSSQWVSAIGGSLAGSVLQVVSTTKTDTYSSALAGSAFTSNVTGLEASITPRSTSSKILCLVELHGSTSGAYGTVFFRLMRDTTAVGVGDTSPNRSQLSSASGARMQQGDDIMGASINYLDSPATTSSITYGVQLQNPDSSSQTVYLNRSHTNTSATNLGRPVSTITLMEIAG